MGSGVADERSAIGTLFNTAWGSTNPTIPVAWPNRPFTPPAGSWVRLTIVGSDSKAVEIGPRSQERRTGTVIVQVFTTLDKGDALGLGLADTVAGIFRNQRVAAGDAGDILFRKPRTRSIGVDAEKAFWQINVEVPFQHDAVLTA